MGKVEIKLKGDSEDMLRIYEHLKYNVKKISPQKGNYDLTSEEMEFDVEI